MKGYWTKGFASTFDPVGAINLGLQWKERKKAQKKIDDAVEQLKLNSTALAAKFDSDRADGSITQQEYSDAVVWALPLGDEIMGRVEKLYSGFRQLTQEQIDNELGEIDAFYNLSENLNFSNLEEMKSFRSNLTQEKAKTKWDLIIKSIESRKAQPTTEVFTTAEAVKAKYPNAGYEYSATAKGYVPTFQKPEAPKTGLDIMGETGKKLDYAYDTGNASHFNQMAKSLGVDTTFETYKKGYEEPEIPKVTPEGEITAGEKRTFDMASSIMFGSSDFVTGISKPGIISSMISSKLNMGQSLTDEEQTEIRNNYNAIKGTLPSEVISIVESQLQRYGISLVEPTPEVTPEITPTTTPEPEPKKWWEFWKGETPKMQPIWGLEEKKLEAPEIPKSVTITKKKVTMKNYSTMSEEKLYKLAMAGDKEAYEEAKRRGLIK